MGAKHWTKATEDGKVDICQCFMTIFTFAKNSEMENFINHEGRFYLSAPGFVERCFVAHYRVDYGLAPSDIRQKTFMPEKLLSFFQIMERFCFPFIPGFLVNTSVARCLTKAYALIQD